MEFSLKLKVVDLERAINYLKQGKILIHPTETCYGLAVDATQSKALDQLFKLKRRDVNKPVSLLLSSAQQFYELAQVSTIAQKLIREFLPGPLTLVLPLSPFAKETLDARVHGGTGWVGLRMTSYCFTQQLAQKYGRPLTTTSANFSGEPEIYDFKILEKNFGDAGLAVLGQEDLPRNPPSTVIKVVEDQVELLREGGISFARILQVVKSS